MEVSESGADLSGVTQECEPPSIIFLIVSVSYPYLDTCTRPFTSFALISLS